MINEQRLLQTFFELVRIDSESGEERAICDELKNKFGALGGHVYEDGAAQITGHAAGNLIVDFVPTADYEAVPTLLFTCHMDTVKPGKGIMPQLDEDGYIRSDGTTILGSDDKAGIAALLEALHVLRESNTPHGRLQLVITIGEESGLLGAKALEYQRIRADLGYAFDANGPVGEIIVAGPSQAKIHAIVHGKAAHAGVNPEAGISAIQVASRAISQMPLGRIDYETTANIGKFVGGGETNIVCDYVEVFAEARSLDENKLNRQIERMKQAFQQAAAAYATNVDVTAEIVYPGFSYDADHPAVTLISNAMQQIGRSAALVKSGGGSDANILNGYGIPTLNVAIGYEQIHTTQEQLPFLELRKTAELVKALINEVTNNGS